MLAEETDGIGVDGSVKFKHRGKMGFFMIRDEISFALIYSEF